MDNDGRIIAILESMATDIKELKAGQKGLEARLDTLEAGLKDLEARFDTLEDRLEEIEAKNIIRHNETKRQITSSITQLSTIVKDNTFDKAMLKAVAGQ